MGAVVVERIMAAATVIVVMPPRVSGGDSVRAPPAKVGLALRLVINQDGTQLVERLLLHVQECLERVDIRRDQLPALHEVGQLESRPALKRIISARPAAAARGPP